MTLLAEENRLRRWSAVTMANRAAPGGGFTVVGIFGDLRRVNYQVASSMWDDDDNLYSYFFHREY